MEQRLRSREILISGLAMFSMFFGAGNTVFPLLIGQYAQNNVAYALGGFILTAVGVPFLGLYVMILFEGNYEAFFARLGRTPGFLIALFIMLIVGPVNAIPRCIALSHGTMALYFPGISLFWFSVVSAALLYATTYKKSKIVDLLGTVLSPLLIVSLLVIIVKGLISHPAAIASTHSLSDVFMHGLHAGYNTMDLLGTFFFASITLASLKQNVGAGAKTSLIAKYALLASCIGASLLALVYLGFGLVSSYYSSLLVNTTPETLIGSLAEHLLGSYGGIIVSIAVALACLTTAMTLVAVFAEFITDKAFPGKITYIPALIGTIAASCFFANFGFEAIVGMASPVLTVLYPALIAVTICNALYKGWGMRTVIMPFLATVAATIYFSFLS